MMRYRAAWLALPIAVAVAGFSYYQQLQQTDTQLRQADAAVDALYRNRTRALPAVHLTARKIIAAKHRLKALNKAPLTPHQAAHLKTAQADLDSATKMLEVTNATQAPVTTDNTYSQSAQAALSAYETLTADKPLFTQVYQQPVTTLHAKAEAADAVDALKTADPVTPEAIANTKDALAKVPNTADAAFEAQAQAVVASAADKLPEQTPAPSTATQPVETTSTSALQTSTNTTSSAAPAQASSSSAAASSVTQPAAAHSSAASSSTASASSSAE